MPRPTLKKSIVWEFFKLSSDKKIASCKLCKKSYANHGNTSNFKEHLIRLHPIQFEEKKAERDPSKRQRRETQPPTNTHQPTTQPTNDTRETIASIATAHASTSQAHVSNISFTTVHTNTRRRQLRLYAADQTTELSPEKNNELDRAVLGLIYYDFQPSF